MKVAVITPFHSAREEWFAQCLASVQAQTYPCTHIVVADGVTPPAMPDFGGQFIALPKTHADYGNTPRAVGSMSAIGQGFDAIAYLDDDNWYHPEHIASLVNLQQQTGAKLCSSARLLHEQNGTFLARCPASGVSFIDTNCYFLSRAAFGLCAHWSLMPPRFHAMGDRYLWVAAHYLRLTHAHSKTASVHYRSTWAVAYQLAGREPPAGSRNFGDADLALLRDMEAHFKSGDWLKNG